MDHGENGKIWDIRERTFIFAVRIIKLCERLRRHCGVSRTLTNQLLRAGTSIGANLEEAQGGQSKPDFISKNSISLKEARETKYWLRIIAASYPIEPRALAEIEELMAEATEISLILGAIIVSAKR